MKARPRHLRSRHARVYVPPGDDAQGPGRPAKRDKARAPASLPAMLPAGTCSPRRAWWMLRLRLLCMVNSMTLPVWLNRGAPATYTRPCLEDTTDVTVYPAAGGNGLVCVASSAGLVGGQAGKRALSLPRTFTETQDGSFLLLASVWGTWPRVL